MDVLDGVAALRPEHGPAFTVVGVFDGLHRGHVYLLDHLVREAASRGARPIVITFDHHPDEVLKGTAPPLLIDPEERLERLAAAGVGVAVVQHFDDALRRTSYVDFVETIRDRTALAGLLMTPDAAFGYEREGTPERLAELGARLGFDVVVVPTFTHDGRPIRSTEIREAIAAGDLATATAMLGRAVTLTGRIEREGHANIVSFASPMAMPPDGAYQCRIGDATATLVVSGGRVRVEDAGRRSGRVSIVLGADAATA